MEKNNNRHSIKHFLFLCFSLAVITAKAQAPSCKESLSPICMIKTGTYNKHTHVTSKDIQIGQGTVFSWNATVDVYIPPNRVGWAIGMAVAHTMFSNLIGIENMSINEYFATALQETNCGCDGSITKPAWVTNKYPVNPAVYCSDYTHGVAVGYFQQEFGTGWAELKKDYPCFIPKVNFDTFVVGKNFETQVLAKVYQDYNSIYYLQQNRCFNPIDFIKQSKDPYAAEKIIAEVYNEGMWGQNLENLLKKNRTAALNATDILPYFCTNGVLNMNGYPSVGYSERISRVTAVLDNNLGDVSATSAQANGVTWVGVHKWRDFYDSQVTWTDIQNYINNISRMYAGVGVTAAAVIAKVKPVFDAINGGNSVSFRYDLGPVIDAIVSALPVFNPTGLGAYGNCGAFPTATMQKSDTVCVGQPLNLTVKFAGKAPFTFTYADTKGNQWTKTGVVSNTYNFAPADTGTYYLVSLSDASGNTGKVVCTPVIKAYNNNGAKGDLQMYGNTGACSGKGLQIKFTGTGPYNIEYSKDGVAQTPVNNITANPYTLIAAPAPLGKYILTKVTAAGCVNTSKDTVDITAGTAPSASISGGAAICQGDSTQLTVALTGVAPFKIKLNDGGTLWYKSGISPAPTSYKFWVKTAGTYTADSVYDAACSAKGTGSASVTLNPVAISTSGDTIMCVGDTAKVTATLTGKAPFTIKATIGAVSINLNTNLSTYVIPFTMPGTYTLELFDANGCKTSKAITIVQIASPLVDLGNDATICKEGTKTLDAGASMQSYSWTGAKTGNAQTMLADLTGKYKVTVTNNDGCKASDSVNITLQSSMITKFAQDTMSICAGTSTTLQLQTLSGGTTPYNYQWSGDASGTNNTYTATAKGTYIITVSDSKGCKSGDTIIVKEKSKLSINLVDKSICLSDSAILSTSLNGAGYTYAWNTGETSSSITVKTAGYYGVVVNSGTCSGSDSMNLTVLNPLAINLGQDQNICVNTKAILDAGNTFVSYLWNTNETASSIQKGAGKYWVKVEDNQGCSATDTIVVNEIPNPKPDKIRDTTICKNSSLTLDESAYNNNNGPYSYLWDDNSTSASLTLSNQTSNSVHWVELTDKYGCKGRDTAHITIKADLNVIVSGNPDTVLCAGTTTVLSSQISGANYQYSWSTGETTPSISVNTSGTYTLNVDDGNGCKGLDAVKVIVNPLPDMTKVSVAAAVCSGDAAVIGYDFGVAYTYSWNTSNLKNARISTTTAGANIFTVISDKGCVNDTTINVTVNQKPLIEIGNNIDTCEGVILMLTDNLNTPGLSYSWTKKSAGATVISSVKDVQINSSDTYKLTATDSNGCRSTDSLNAVFKITPQIDLLGGKDSAVICNKETITLDAGTGIPETEYLWLPSKEIGKTITVDEEGTHWVIVRNGNCYDSDTVFVQSLALPENVLTDALFPIKSNYCFAEEANGVEISAIGLDGLNYSYLWNTNETTQKIVVKQKGTYTVEIQKDICKTSSSVSIVDYCETNFYIPDAFTPNSDNNNDVFKVYGAYIPNFEILIFNRWGEQIYHSKDYTQGWDGTYMGNKVQEDVYVVKILYGVNQENGTVKRHERLSKLVVLY
jgi:gliding motility-associated-like protein